MSFEIQYRYCELGETLADELLLHVHRGESFVLLGYQGVGKRHALAILGSRLERENVPHLVVFLRDNHIIVTEAELLKALKMRLRHFRCDGITEALSGATTLADWFHRLGERTEGNCLPIGFANIDWLADPLKEQFLTLVRNSVQMRRLVVGITGESLLARTLAKETSPFQCAYQFVLTGYNRETSRKFFMKRVSAYGLRFSDSKEPSWNAETAFECLYQRTGGNITLLRAILWELSEHRLRFDSELESDWGIRRFDVEQGYFDHTSIHLFGLRPFQAAKSLIQEHRDALLRLEQLLDRIQAACDQGLDPEIASTATSIPAECDTPEPLELMGIVKRDPETNHLVFSSSYVAEFAIHYFSWTCRGDFHAKQGNWQEAFERYKKVKVPERLRRPIGENDFYILGAIVNRLCRHFAECITKEDSIDQLSSLISDSGKLLFGLKSARVIQLDERGNWIFHQNREATPDDFDARIQTISRIEPPYHTRNELDDNYLFHTDPSCRTLVVRSRPGRRGRPEMNPRHALLFESDEEGPVIEGLRLRLLGTIATSFLTCFDEARVHKRMFGSRLRLGEALQKLFQGESIRESLEALGGYLHTEFLATGVRLFLIDAGSGDLKSSKSWGFKDQALRHRFDSGGLTLKKGVDSELWAALSEGKAVAFRWCPPDRTIPSSNTDLQYRSIPHNAYSDQVERQPGDFWIDFPLFVGDVPYGKLTLAFPSHSPPPARYIDDLGVISEILAHHLKRFESDGMRLAEARSLQQRAIAVTAHDLATRISSLPIFLADYRDLEVLLTGGEQLEIRRINDRFQTRLQAAMDVLERAKLRLSEVKPVPSEFNLLEVVHDALRSIDRASGAGRTEVVNPGSDNGILINADKSLLSGVFLELVSDSVTMYAGKASLQVQIRIVRQPENNLVVVDYTDNGPGVPEQLKERIFEYLVSYRPGQKRQGLGVGLGFVKEAIHAHHGTIKEVGQFGQGVHFHIELPIKFRSP